MKYATIFMIFMALFVLSACTTTPGATQEKTTETTEDTAALETVEEETKVEYEKAPTFSATTTSGKAITFDGAIDEGKPTVLYFMASWCPQCAKNWKGINAAYPKYKDDVNFLAISVDPTDSSDLLADLAIDKGFVFETIPGNSGIPQEFGVKQQTVKFGIDAEGNIVYEHTGVLKEDEWDMLFKELTT